MSRFTAFWFTIFFAHTLQASGSTLTTNKTEPYISILVDSSNSMKNYRAKVAKKLYNYAPAAAEIVMFGDRHTSKTFLTGQTLKSEYAYKQAYKPWGNSPLYDAVIERITKLNTLENNNKVLLIISDFEDQGSKATEQDVMNAINKSTVTVIKDEL